MGYQTITSIAKTFGRTIAQMKIILAQEGLLSENGPTEKALSLQTARLRELDPETARYDTNGKTHYAQWRFEDIEEIFAAKGEAKSDRIRVANRYDALKKIQDAAALMRGMPGVSQRYLDALDCGHAGAIGFPILLLEKDALSKFRDEFSDIRALIKKKRGNWKAVGVEVTKRLDAVDDFLRRQGLQ